MWLLKRKKYFLWSDWVAQLGIINQLLLTGRSGRLHEWILLRLMLLHLLHGQYLVVKMVWCMHSCHSFVFYMWLECNWFNHVLHAGLRLFKEAKERDSLGRVSIFFSLNLFWKMNHVLIIPLPDFTVGWSSGYHGCWSCWWNLRNHFPNASFSWTLKIRVSTTTTLLPMEKSSNINKRDLRCCLLFSKLKFSKRCRWDFCFYQGSVVEHLDGHTDIIHKQLYSDWLPW